MATSSQTIVKFSETLTNRDLDAHYVPIAHNDFVIEYFSQIVGCKRLAAISLAVFLVFGQANGGTWEASAILPAVRSCDFRNETFVASREFRFGVLTCTETS